MELREYFLNTSSSLRSESFTYLAGEEQEKNCLILCYAVVITITVTTFYSSYTSYM